MHQDECEKKIEELQQELIDNQNLTPSGVYQIYSELQEMVQLIIGPSREEREQAKAAEAAFAKKEEARLKPEVIIDPYFHLDHS
mgnify:CR=1 FL=1